MWSGGPRASPRYVELRGRQALAGLGLLGQKDGPLHAYVSSATALQQDLVEPAVGTGIASAARSSRATGINVIDVDVAAAVDAAQLATEVALDSRHHLVARRGHAVMTPRRLRRRAAPREPRRRKTVAAAPVWRLLTRQR